MQVAFCETTHVPAGEILRERDTNIKDSEYEDEETCCDSLEFNEVKLTAKMASCIRSSRNTNGKHEASLSPNTRVLNKQWVCCKSGSQNCRSLEHCEREQHAIG